MSFALKLSDRYGLIILDPTAHQMYVTHPFSLRCLPARCRWHPGQCWSNSLILFNSTIQMVHRRSNLLTLYRRDDISKCNAITKTEFTCVVTENTTGVGNINIRSVRKGKWIYWWYTGRVNKFKTLATVDHSSFCQCRRQESWNRHCSLILL